MSNLKDEKEHPLKEEDTTLQILEEVKFNYERKLKQLECFKNSPSVIELKFNIYLDWITYLQEENKLLTNLIKDIESEAVSQIRSFKEKLANTSKTAKESLEKKTLEVKNNLEKVYRETIRKYDSDVNNMVQFIKRIRETNRWTAGGLKFHYVTYNDLYGDPSSNPETIEQKFDHLIKHLKNDVVKFQQKQTELENELKKKNKIIKNQEQTIRKLTDDASKITCLDSSSIIKNEITLEDESSKSALKVWECSKEVTNNIIQIWEKMVHKKKMDRYNVSPGECKMVMDQDKNSINALQEAIYKIAEELKESGSISDDIKGDALLFFVFDRNKKMNKM